MFADHVAVLHQCVAEREIALYQRRLNERRATVRRDLLAAADDRFLETLKNEIARANTSHGYRAVLKTYTVEEVEAREGWHNTSLGEVLTGTDVLQRVANCLAPGHFKCSLRRQRCRKRRVPDQFHIDVTFVATGFEPPKLPCSCIIHDLVDGWCCCGGYGRRAPVMNPEDED